MVPKASRAAVPDTSYENNLGLSNRSLLRRGSLGFSRDRGAILRFLGGGEGAPLVTQYWGGTRHFFLLILYNFKNIWGGTRAPPAPLLHSPCFQGRAALFSLSPSLSLSLAPAYLQEQFKKLKDSVPYNLRNADVNLALPKPNSEYLKKSFGYSGAVAWNSLPRNLQNSKTLNEFRQNLNSYRLHQGSY